MRVVFELHSSIQHVFSPIFFILAVQQISYALPAQSLDFFLSPESSLSSGQASSLILEQNKVQTLAQSKTLVSINNKNLEASPETLAYDIHVSKWVMPTKNIQLKKMANDQSENLKELVPTHHLKILSFEKQWAQVEVLNLKGYVKIVDLISNYHDKGRFFSFVDTFLRIKPSQKSNLHTTIPKQTILEALSEDKNWIEVKYQGIRGFVDKHHLLSKLDFATQVEVDKKWLDFQAKKHQNLKDVQGIKTIKDKGIVIQPNGSLDLRNEVKILAHRDGKWHQSLLKSHGLVWWKDSDLMQLRRGPRHDTETLSIDQLLRRDIYSISFHPNNKKMALASSKGIYFTEDGHMWKKLSQFEDQNLPVFVHSDGSWFIGPYRSINKGESFSEFLQAQKIAQLLEASKKTTPKYVKLVQLKSLSLEKIEMQLDTGYERVTLISRNSGQGWVVQ